MKNYRKKVLFTESLDFETIRDRTFPWDVLRLLHASLGMATEAAELLDAIKRHIFYGAPLDDINIKEEIGDSDWYREIILDVFGWTDDDVKRTNIAKLSKRYPDGFVEKDAVDRNLDAERAVLEESETK